MYSLTFMRCIDSSNLFLSHLYKNHRKHKTLLIVNASVIKLTVSWNIVRFTSCYILYIYILYFIYSLLLHIPHSPH